MRRPVVEITGPLNKFIHSVIMEKSGDITPTKYSINTSDFSK